LIPVVNMPANRLVRAGGTLGIGTPPESDTLLAADTISTVYAAYLSASRAGAEVRIPLV